MKLDMFGHPIEIGNFIIYGSGRGEISYGVVSDITTEGKIKIKIVEAVFDYAQRDPQLTGWKTRILTLTNAVTLVVPIETYEVHNLPYYASKQDLAFGFEQKWRELYRDINLKKAKN